MNWQVIVDNSRTWICKSISHAQNADTLEGDMVRAIDRCRIDVATGQVPRADDVRFDIRPDSGRITVELVRNTKIDQKKYYYKVVVPWIEDQYFAGEGRVDNVWRQIVDTFRSIIDLLVNNGVISAFCADVGNGRSRVIVSDSFDRESETVVFNQLIDDLR